MQQKPSKILSSEEEEKLERNLIWIFGFSHPGINQTSNRLLSGPTNFLNEPKIGLLVNHIIPWKGDSKPQTSFDLRQKMGNSKKPKYDYFFYNGFQDTWKFYLRKLIINRIYLQFPNFFKKTVILETTGSAAAPIISDIFPNSKILIVSVDGMYLVNHQIEKMNKPKDNHPQSISKFLTERKTRIKEYSNRWNTLATLFIQAFEGHNTKLRLMIDYQDLERNNLETLTKFFQFFDITISENELQKIMNNQQNDNNTFENEMGWEKNFDLEEKNTLKKIMEKNLKLLGY